ncbi:helix-turn-helix transcriptional regulator [Rhodocytophaga rosea]|uniref:Helix-turn-helix transcriptional regulator n=2 Tax=Rhodocytophaga rosea TaxID=2704465 RepID=A0A6C0GE46_9BACT|nr:helix-turn-helix transcriptional regulator [Rhodocytophaga rosea]
MEKEKKKPKWRPEDDKQCMARLAGIGDALYAIGGKWKLQIIVALTEGVSRFNEIQRTITGISSKVLAAELKELELNGFVKRTIIAQTPVTIEYKLTDYALTLHQVLDALSDWGTKHRAKIKQEMK